LQRLPISIAHFELHVRGSGLANVGDEKKLNVTDIYAEIRKITNRFGSRDPSHYLEFMLVLAMRL
jgi:hypothetical protein